MIYAKIPVIPAEAAQPRRAGTQVTGLGSWVPALRFAAAGMARGGATAIPTFLNPAYPAPNMATIQSGTRVGRRLAASMRHQSDWAWAQTSPSGPSMRT